MNSQAGMAEALAPFQQALTQGWSKVVESFQPGASSHASGALTPPQLTIPPDKLKSIQQQYVADVADLWRQGFASNADRSADKRFAGESWGTTRERRP